MGAVKVVFGLIVSALLAPQDQPFDPSSWKPFTDGASYLGKYETGLYPAGKNTIPEVHQKAGERIAATLRPLDPQGKPAPSGRILALVLGPCALGAVDSPWRGRREGVVMIAGKIARRNPVRDDRPWGSRRRGRGPSLRLVGGAEGWRFTDFVPPPLRGSIAGVPVSLRLWPPDVIPTHPEAFRVRTGVLAGFWAAVAFP